MHDRLQEAKHNFWESDFYGIDACPESFDQVKQDYVDTDLSVYTDVDACGCWMSIHNYNMYAGPYQDLQDDQIHYNVHEENLIIQGIVAQRKENMKKSYIINLFDIGNLNDFKSNFVIYMALIITTIILLFVAVRNCQKTKMRRNRNKRQIPSYGTVRRV